MTHSKIGSFLIYKNGVSNYNVYGYYNGDKILSINTRFTIKFIDKYFVNYDPDTFSTLFRKNSSFILKDMSFLKDLYHNRHRQGSHSPTPKCKLTFQIERLRGEGNFINNDSILKIE
jgi:hypothetical protein